MANDRMSFGDLANVTTKRLTNHPKVSLNLFYLLLLHRSPFLQTSASLGSGHWAVKGSKHLAIQAPVLDGFRHVLGGDRVPSLQVRDRARDLEDPHVGARRSEERRVGKEGGLGESSVPVV